MAIKKEKVVSIEHYKKFMEGEKPFPEATFTLRSDVWDLYYRETQAVQVSQSRLTFKHYPKWIKPAIQDFIAWSLFYEGLSNGTLRNATLSLKHFVEYLGNYHENLDEIEKLDEIIAKKYVLHLKNVDDVISTRKYRHFNAVKKFAGWLRKNELTGENFRFGNNPFSNPTKEKRTVKETKNKAIPIEVTQQIMKAIATEEKVQEEIMKDNSSKVREKNVARTKLTYCQLLKLLIATGRRISHLLKIKREPLIEPKEEDSEGVWLEWQETKTKQGLKPVFIPTPLDEIVREAVRKTQILTEPFLDFVSPQEQSLLFLKGDNGGISSISATNFRIWLNGDKRTVGFNTRYKIQYEGKIYHIKPHGFRHARATEMYLGGAGHGTVQNDLAHVKGSDMTNHYIHVYGDDETVKEMHELRLKGQLSGKLAEVEVESGKQEELTLEKEKLNLKELGRKAELTMIPEEQYEHWEKHGMAVQNTRYGYCVYPLEKGTCPVGDPCWLGKDGKGCDYHLYGPQIKEEVEKDLERTKERLDRMMKKNPNSPLVGHYKAVLEQGSKVINNCTKGCNSCREKK